MSAFTELNKTPGPGSYEPERYGKKFKISYSMARKYDEKPYNQHPGPGSYKKKSFIDEVTKVTKKGETFS